RRWCPRPRASARAWCRRSPSGTTCRCRCPGGSRSTGRGSGRRTPAARGTTACPGRTRPRASPRACHGCDRSRWARRRRNSRRAWTPRRASPAPVPASPRSSHPPAARVRSSPLFLHLVQIRAVALLLHPLAGDEAQRRRVDAVSQAAALRGTIREHVAQVAVAVGRADLGADHAVAGVAQLAHVRRLQRPGEARPAAMRVELVAGGEQRLARDDVHVDPGTVLVQVLAGAGTLGPGFLGHAVLLRGEPGDRVRILAPGTHCGTTRQIVLDRSSATISAPRGSTVTPTGRPRVLPSSPRKPDTKSIGSPAGRPLRNGTNTTL